MSPHHYPQSRLNLSMDPSLKTALLNAAALNGTTASRIITQALNQYLKQRESRCRKSNRGKLKKEASACLETGTTK